MADYALFLKCNFNVLTGNFERNGQARKPDARFWSEVKDAGGTLTARGKRINGDTSMSELGASKSLAGTPDNLYFAVRILPAGTPLRSISFSCGLQPAISINRGTVSSPFRAANSVNGEIQCLLTGTPSVSIMSGAGGPPGSVSEEYLAIGPFRVFADPDPRIQAHDCCFYKFTVVASVASGGAGSPSREYSYDPDMDVEMDL